jgi:sucrose-6-phosphate hydrolase SacC (GH32 family)
MEKSSENSNLIMSARQLRAKLLSDRHRPTYHFVTPEGVCMPFDPNGAIFWKGKYHLCYIFQDERGHCWGHASSKDLVHWRHHPPALTPNPGDPDRGIFSGNAFVNKQGEAVILYHGVNAGNCIAVSSENDLDHWTKLPSNPIVPSPKKGDPDFGKYSSWDPHGWLEGDTYYAVFGGNPATLFKSEDMIRWSFIGPLLSEDMPDVNKDEDISCPDLFKLGDKHMLLCISHKRGCRYYLGRFENERFYPEQHARMNWPGGTCFAPESLMDGQGRRIMWAWVLDQCSQRQLQESGWSGTMTLPRVLSLGKDGRLQVAPVEELQALRLNHRRFEDLTIRADSELRLEDIYGDCLELAVEMQPQEAGEFGLKVRCSPQGEEKTIIVYDSEQRCLRLELAKSTLDSEVIYRTFCMYGGENPAVTVQEAPFELKQDERLQLRIFLDRSILEVFANGRQCLTQRIYPTRADSLGVVVFARKGSAAVTFLEAWDMAPANPW